MNFTDSHEAVSARYWEAVEKFRIFRRRWNIGLLCWVVLSFVTSTFFFSYYGTLPALASSVIVIGAGVLLSSAYVFLARLMESELLILGAALAVKQLQSK